LASRSVVWIHRWSIWWGSGKDEADDPDDEDSNSVEVDQHDSYEIVGMKHVEENPVNRPEVGNDEDDEKNHEFRDDEIQ
jgi:hypothetical protein